MRRQDDATPGSRWRAILEARWRTRLQEITELSLEYHAAAAAARDGTGDRHARRLLRRAVAARQRLADTEEALGRLAAGRFGRCEQCGGKIPATLLAAVPEMRYCGRCAADAGLLAPVSIRSPHGADRPYMPAGQPHARRRQDG